MRKGAAHLRPVAADQFGVEQGWRGFDRVRDVARWAETSHRRRPWAALAPAVALAVVGLVAAGAADDATDAGDVAAEISVPATTERATAPTTTTLPTTVTTATTAPSTTVAPAPAPVVEDEPATPTTAERVIATGPATPAPTRTDVPPVGADCTPGYDPCLITGDYDVDCENTGGDGPRFVRGPLDVAGDDPYQLDPDGDGVACEPPPTTPPG